MNPLLYKRLRNEQKILDQNINENFYLKQKKDSNSFEGFIKGPQGSLYEKSIFRIQIVVPEDFPIIPPQIFFVDKLFHPNIKFETGEVCVDILKENWSPTMTLYSLTIVLQFLLQEPNPKSPLNIDASYLFLKRHEDYNKLARYFAQFYQEQLNLIFILIDMSKF